MKFKLHILLEGFSSQLWQSFQENREKPGWPIVPEISKNWKKSEKNSLTLQHSSSKGGKDEENLPRYSKCSLSSQSDHFLKYQGVTTALWVKMASKFIGISLFASRSSHL